MSHIRMTRYIAMNGSYGIQRRGSMQGYSVFGSINTFRLDL